MLTFAKVDYDTWANCPFIMSWSKLLELAKWKGGLPKLHDLHEYQLEQMHEPKICSFMHCLNCPDAWAACNITRFRQPPKTNAHKPTTTDTQVTLSIAHVTISLRLLARLQTCQHTPKKLLPTSLLLNLVKEFQKTTNCPLLLPFCRAGLRVPYEQCPNCPNCCFAVLLGASTRANSQWVLTTPHGLSTK